MYYTLIFLNYKNIRIKIVPHSALAIEMNRYVLYSVQKVKGLYEIYVLNPIFMLLERRFRNKGKLAKVSIEYFSVTKITLELQVEKDMNKIEALILLMPK